jgi:cardiolipin hydrolase
MHHKFAIIDKAKLLNGSFNWTRAAVITNQENVVVTKHAPGLLAAFDDEFEKLWAAFRANTKLPPGGAHRHHR